MTDIEADGVGSGKVARARVRVLCSVRCTGRIGVWTDLGLVSDVRASARLRFRITVNGGHANVYG